MVQIQAAPIQDVAFPRLTSAETAEVKKMATVRDYADGETVFRAGQAEYRPVCRRVGPRSKFRIRSTVTGSSSSMSRANSPAISTC